MYRALRWVAATIVVAGAFILAWWVCEGRLHMSRGDSLGIAAFLAGVVIAPPCTWWASREHTQRVLPQGSSYLRGTSSSTLPPTHDWPLVEDVDPLILGVHRTRPEKGRDVLPPYVPRDIDSEIKYALQAAASYGGFVLLTGDSAAGKSRTAFHAMKQVLSGYHVLSPSHGTDLRQLPGLLDDADSMRCVLWLDDLEGHLGSPGLQTNLLSELLRRKVVIVATIRHEQSELFRPHRARSLADSGDRRAQQDSYLGAQILNIATSIEVPRKWSNSELNRVVLYDDPRLLEALDHRDLHGIAEYVAAGPQLLQEWHQAARAGGNPRGAALVSAAVDLARAGLTGYVAQSLLEELHPSYLTATGGPLLHPEPLTDAIRWASAIRYGVTSMLLPGPNESWRPFDYLVDSSTRDTEEQVIPEEIWWVALEHAASPSSQYNIGVSAFASAREDIAESAWQAAASAGEVMAMVSLGALLASQGQAVDGEIWSRRSAEAGDAIGAFNLAVLLTERGEIVEAKSWYSLATEAGVSDAAINLGNLYADEGREDEAEKCYRRAVSLGNPSGLFNLGFEFSNRGEHEQAEKYYYQAATAGHLMAANRLGLLYARQERLDEAELWLQLAAESDLIAAQINLANIFVRQQRHDEAEPWYRKAYTAGEPHAALRLGDMFATIGQAGSAEHWWKIAADTGVVEATDRQITTVHISHELTRTITDKKTREKLGEAGLEDVYRNLWPRDCQSCGKPLGSAIPSLRINDLIVFGSADLHHPSCRAPEWSEHPTMTNQPLTSWQALALVTEVLTTEKEQKVPVTLGKPCTRTCLLEAYG